MSYLIADILSDATTTAAATFASGAFSMGPPEQAQAFGPWGFLEYGGGVIEQASDEVTTHTLLFHCMVPTRGNFGATGGEYAQAIAQAMLIHRAFYANVLIGTNNDAAISSNGIIGKPDLFVYAGVQCVRCVLTIECVTSEDVSALTAV